MVVNIDMCDVSLQDYELMCQTINACASSMHHAPYIKNLFLELNEMKF